MKKTLTMIAIAATAMIATSCTSEDDFQTADSNKKIAFSTSLPLSRAVTTINNLGDFAIDAFLTQEGKVSKYINAETVSKKDGVWSTANDYLWPHSGELQFFAVYPSNIKVTYPADNDFAQTAPQFTYMANSNAESEQDLIYAVNKKSCASAYGTEANAPIVDINFRHALAQVVFKAKNTNPKWELDIDNVKIQNIHSSGNYSLPTNTTAAGNGVRGKWEVANIINNYVTHFNPVTNIGAEGKVLTSADNGAFLLVPQKHEAWDRTNDRYCQKQGSYFLVSCKIRQVLDNGDKILLWPSAEKDAYAEVAIPVSINWEEGKQYVYTFIFGDSAGFLPPGQTEGGDPVIPGDPSLAKIGYNVTVLNFDSEVTNTDIKM